jgi:hypothetical protein
MVRSAVLSVCDGQFVLRADGKALTTSNADARQSHDNATIVLCDLRCWGEIKRSDFHWIKRIRSTKCSK